LGRAPPTGAAAGATGVGTHGRRFLEFDATRGRNRGQKHLIETFVGLAKQASDILSGGRQSHEDIMAFEQGGVVFLNGRHNFLDFSLDFDFEVDKSLVEGGFCLFCGCFEHGASHFLDMPNNVFFHTLEAADTWEETISMHTHLRVEELTLPLSPAQYA
jgi:hypothetical protein